MDPSASLTQSAKHWRRPKPRRCRNSSFMSSKPARILCKVYQGAQTRLRDHAVDELLGEGAR